MSTHGLLQDLRAALRHYRARRGLAVFSVVVLSLGIGATIAAFALVRGLMLQALPFPNANDVVSVGGVPMDRTETATLSHADLQRLRQDSGAFEELAAWVPRSVVLGSVDGGVVITAASGTPSLFRVLRVAPELGRSMQDPDAVEGAQRVALLSYRTWATRFGSDPRVVGTSVALDAEAHVVIGVLPRDFSLTYPNPEVWIPLIVRPQESASDDEMVVHGALAGIGRLRSGVSPAAAAAEVDAILKRDRGDRRSRVGREYATRVVRLQEERARPVRPALMTFGAASGVLLLMACANTAGLLLSNGIARVRQFAVRAALGASGGRIARQLLLESGMIGLAAGGLALGLATALLRVAPLLVPTPVPGLTEVRVDGVVVAATVLVSVGAAGLAGIVPAVAVAGGAVSRALSEGSAAVQGGFGRLRVNRAHGMLAVAEVALAVVLVSTASILLRAFVALIAVDVGFEPANVLATRVETPLVSRAFSRVGGRIAAEELNAMRAASWGTVARFVNQLDRIRTLPGVEAAAVTSSFPLQPASIVRSVSVLGETRGGDPGDRMRAGIRRVTASYVDVVGLRLIGGRFFGGREGAGSASVAVVSESFARSAVGDESIIGRYLRLEGLGRASRGQANGGDGRSWEIVGVVADVESPLGQGLLERAPAGEIYLPILQEAADRSALFMQPVLVVRTATSASTVMPFLREVLVETHPRGRIHTTSLATTLALHAAQPRFYAGCAAILGAVALLLAATSLFGVLSFVVANRRREIGLRMALGATRFDVLGLVAMQGGSLVLGGLMLGLVGAIAAADMVNGLIVGAADMDILAATSVAAVLGAVGMAACYIPARQAALVDPTEALHDH